MPTYLCVHVSEVCDNIVEPIWNHPRERVRVKSRTVDMIVMRNCSQKVIAVICCCASVSQPKVLRGESERADGCASQQVEEACCLLHSLSVSLCQEVMFCK